MNIRMISVSQYRVWSMFSLAMVLAAIFSGCTEQSKTIASSFAPLASTAKNRLALVCSSPAEGDGKLLVLDLAKGVIEEASHRLDRDPRMQHLKATRQIAVLNRRRGAVQIFDETTLKLQTEYRGVDSPDFINFQDVIELGGDEAYFSSWETDRLYRLRLSDGKLMNQIDLKPYADADGIPEGFKLFHLERDRIGLILQRLAHRTGIPTDYSSMVVIDPLTDTVEEEMRLDCKNPLTTVNKVGPQLVAFGCAGDWGKAQDGAIEAFDFATRKSKGTWWDAVRLQGRPIELVGFSPLFFAALLSTPSGGTRLITLNGGAGATPDVWGDSPYETGYRTIALDLERRLLWVGKAGKAGNSEPAVFAYALDSKEIVREIRLEFNPTQLEWLD